MWLDCLSSNRSVNRIRAYPKSSIEKLFVRRKNVWLKLMYSICFAKDARCYNEIDVQIAEKLENIVRSHSLSRIDIYSRLIDAKNSISTFTFRDILHKDSKLVHPFDNLRVITSSINGQLVRNLILTDQREQILADLQDISRELDYSLVLMMGIRTTKLNSIERDLAIYSLNENLLKRVSQTLLDHNNKELDIHILETKCNLIIFEQNNVRCSRKVVLPIIEELFRSDQFLVDWSAGVFSSKRPSNNDRLQRIERETNDSLKSIPGAKLINGLSHECKLNGQMIRSASAESTSSTNKSIMDGRPPESINYCESDYGSYFMDSFPGEFTGEVANDKLNDQQINELNWCDEQRIENALEFGFDSFGPESILFQTTSNDLLGSSSKKLETIKESNEKNDDLKKADRFNDDDEFDTKKKKKSVSSLVDQQIANSEDYEDLVSLSLAEPQLKQKLDTCFDANKIRNGYDITAQPTSILVFDRSLSGGANRFDQNFEEFTNRQQPHNKDTDKFENNEREDFRMNDKDSSEILEDENFNSLIENSQIKTTLTDNLSKGIEAENSSDSGDSQLPPNDITVDIANSNSIHNTTNNTSTTITDLSIENDDKLNEGNFKRQSTLTKSQRKRITPKYKFETMPSTLDDTNLILNNGASDLLEQLAKEDQLNSPVNDNHLFQSPVACYHEPAINSPSDGLKSGYASRTGTLPKKKILADIKEDSHEENSKSQPNGLENQKDILQQPNHLIKQSTPRKDLSFSSEFSQTNKLDIDTNQLVNYTKMYEPVHAELGNLMRAVPDQLRNLNEATVNMCTQRITAEINKDIKNIQANLTKALKDNIKMEIKKGLETQAASLEDSVIMAVRLQAQTPAPSMFDVQEQIKSLLIQGQINKAFHQALLANDLHLVEYALERADYNQVFNPCPLEQTVLLSLIQQISADMSNHTDLKQKYLSDAIINLNMRDPITKEHAPKVLKELLVNCQNFVSANPHSSLSSGVRMVIMAVQGFGISLM